MMFNKSHLGVGHIILPDEIRVDLRRVGEKMCTLTYEEVAGKISKKRRRIADGLRDNRSELQIAKDTAEVFSRSAKDAGQDVKVHVKQVRGRIVLGFTMKCLFRDACTGIVSEFLMQSDFSQIKLGDIIKNALQGAAMKQMGVADMKTSKQHPAAKPPTKKQISLWKKEDAARADQFKKYMVDTAVANGCPREEAERFVEAYAVKPFTLAIPSSPPGPRLPPPTPSPELRARARARDVTYNMLGKRRSKQVGPQSPAVQKRLEELAKREESEAQLKETERMLSTKKRRRRAPVLRIR